MTQLAADDRFLRLPEVERMTGMRKSTIYELMHRKAFPDRYQVGPKIVIWLESEVRDWMTAQIDRNAASASARGRKP